MRICCANKPLPDFAGWRFLFGDLFGLKPLWYDVAELSSRVNGAPLTQWQALESVCLEAASGGGSFGPVASDSSQGRSLEGLKIRRNGESPPAESATDGWYELLRELRSRIEANTPQRGLGDLGLGGFGDLENSIDSFDSLSPGQLEEAMQAVQASMSRVDTQLGTLLFTFQRLRLYQNIGYRSVAEYTKERLGLSSGKVGALVRLERSRYFGREEIWQAYDEGRISWIRAMAVLMVAVGSNTEAWVQRAEQITVRRLYDEVRWALDMRDRAMGAIDLEPPPFGTELERSDAEADRQMRARLKPYQRKRIREYRDRGIDGFVWLRFSGPASVMSMFRDLLNTYRAPSGAWEAAREPFKRMLLHVKAEWLSGPHHPNPIHERDGWRCRVPACSSRQNLQEHHIVFRSRGGGNERGNRVSICAWHHLRGIHGGRVKAQGDAEENIYWELGGRLRFVDDRYAPA